MTLQPSHGLSVDSATRTQTLGIDSVAETRTLDPGDAGPVAGAVANLPGYELLDELGRGGMGVVYRARDQKLGRTVAVKVVLGGAIDGSKSLIRFLAEAEALAAIQHPHVIQVFDRGQHQGLAYFVMEYCPGGSLGTKVRDNPLNPREAAELVEKLARGVAAAHAAGILHRDLKPENVLLTADGTPKLTDFGLAKRLETSGADGLTHTGAQMGTPSYMAPEQAKGESKRTGPGTDIYGLGAILYRLVTGRPPFIGSSAVETMRQVVDEDPPSPTVLTPGLPRDLATICVKCLAKDPAQRYSTATEFAEDLQRFLDGRAILARPAWRIERFWKFARRHRGATVAAGISVVILVVGTIVSATFAFRASAAAEREAGARSEVEAQKQILRNFLRSIARNANLTRAQQSLLQKQFLEMNPDIHSEELELALDDVKARASEAGTQPSQAISPRMFGD